MSTHPHYACMIEIEEPSGDDKDLFEQLLEEEPRGRSPTNSPLHNHANLATEPEYQGCKCSKIDCLKLYCECFAKGRTCTSQCVCVCCHNSSEHSHEIYQAQRVANYRNPGYFKHVPAYVPVRRCTCKKSSCRKNYCQCYRTGEKCSEDCECLDCQNGKPHTRQSWQMALEEFAIEAAA